MMPVQRLRRTYLGGAILCCALGGGQLSSTLGAAFARVAVVDCALAHLVSLACDCWVNCVGRALGRGVLGQWLCARLPCTGSEQMFS
jgi:hypothetical protein